MSIKNSARYMPLNMVAYTWGNAAKVAPPAVSIHTSLPSHTGVMVLSIMRRSVSSSEASRDTMPTP